MKVIKNMRKTIAILIISSFILSSCVNNERSPSQPVPVPTSKIKLSPKVQPATPKWATKNNISSQETSHISNGKHALLIGIEKYNHPKISDLNGAINDIKLMQGVLRDRFKFKKSDFIVLLNQQATHSAIEAAFKKLIQRIQPNDFVYIHYSGHGSQTADLNGDEPSGLDQTWVSYGTRQAGRENEKDNYEVLDDEINAWLAAIYAKTEQVIFVSDSCHSATVSRGNVPVSRGLEADERSHLLGKMPYTQLNEYHGIHVGAARNKEFAAETEGDDGKDYGIFTWHWAKALQQAQVGETWDDVFKRAYTPVFSKRGEAQRPQLEGKRYRQVFGGKLTPPIATVAVSNVNGNLVKIRAGATVGVTVGSIYRLHRQPKNKARIEITKVGTFKSEAKITKGRFKLGDLLVEESHAYDFKTIKVYLSADYPQKDRALLQSIRTAFQNSSEIPAYVLTNKANMADLRLQLLRPKRGKNGQSFYEHEKDALPKSYSNQSPELWVLTPDQHLLHKKLQIKFSDKSKGLELLKYNLNHFARLREIKALKSSSQASSPVKLEPTILKPVKTCTTGGNCMQLHDLGFYEKKELPNFQEIGRQSLNKNDILTFTLHNTSRKDYYCYLINISPDGTIFAIYPDPEERMEYARVKAGEKRELINDVILILKNAGEQSLKFLATTRPIQISLLQKDGYRGNQSKLNPLERLLVSAAHGERGTLIKISNDEWVTEQVAFEVK